MTSRWSEVGGQWVTWSDPIWIDGPGTFYERATAGRSSWPMGDSLGDLLRGCGGAESGGKKPLYGVIHRSDDSGKTWKTISVVGPPRQEH
ncbi:MAG: hypothetical protein Ct9H300mP1_22740 [Planctomycetaceae bacterium]|nr:MAG: hypothetical protein Ct9H300mP1_22740 [Planctomycetaceae bacterium]